MISKHLISSGILLGLLSCSQPPVKPLELKGSSSPAKDDDLIKGEPDDVDVGEDNDNDGESNTDTTDTGGKTDTDKPDTDPKDTGMQDPPIMEMPKDEVKDPGTEGDGDFTIGPNYADAPETKEKSGVPKGEVKEFTMNSKDSQIYRGQDSYLKEKGDFSRKGWLYIPAGYKGEKELPFMLVGDGSWDQHRDLMSRVLNNLIADKKVPPMAVVFINPGPLGGGDGPGSQRSFEYDSVNGTFGDWVETEVLPKMTKDFGVKFTSNPEGRGTMGGSSSGAMAFTMAWFKPDKYRRVLTYSGTFVNRIQTAEHPQGAWEYHQKMIPQSDKKPLRVFIHVSDHDNNFGGDNNWEQANRAMAKAFKDKGYHYRFQFSKDAGHIDGKVYRQTLPENLIWLWRGYPIP